MAAGEYPSREQALELLEVAVEALESIDLRVLPRQNGPNDVRQALALLRMRVEEQREHIERMGAKVPA